jgi:hypothetical protein
MRHTPTSYHSIGRQCCLMRPARNHDGEALHPAVAKKAEAPGEDPPELRVNKALFLYFRKWPASPA